jgi:thiosulfate dehydrogenase [quinone] large subunit
MNSNETSGSGDSGATWAFLTLRLWLGARALLAGVEKFSEKITIEQPLRDASGAPDPSGAVVEVQQKVYGLAHYHAIPDALTTKLLQEPLLPQALTTAFLASLGYALIVLGAMLLLGICTRCALGLMGVLYTLLMAGLLLIHQEDGVAWLGIHAGLVAFALALSRHNRFTLTRKC